DSSVVLLLAGPRLDGSRLDGIQHQAMQMLARGVASMLEAGMLRERAEDETRFRAGLTELARDLAAAATVVDVEHCLNTHAVRLLDAASATLWRDGPSGWRTVLDEADAAAQSVTVLRELNRTLPRERDWSQVIGDGSSLAFALDDGADEPLVCLV